MLSTQPSSVLPGPCLGQSDTPRCAGKPPGAILVPQGAGMAKQEQHTLQTARLWGGTAAGLRERNTSPSTSKAAPAWDSPVQGGC